MHCIYILKCKLSTKADAKLYSHIIVVLCIYRIEAGVYNSINKVIKAATSPEKANYIHDNWLKTLLI